MTSNERCALSRVLFNQYCYNNRKCDLDLLHLTLTFFLDLWDIWPWDIYYYLDALKKTLKNINVLTSRDAKTTYVRRRPTLISISVRSILQPTRSLYGSGSKVMAQKVIFMVFDVFDLTLTFQGHLIFVNSMTGVNFDMFINSGDIAHWNMEKLPILYNGNFRCHGNVCYVFRINPIFWQITSDRSKQYVCQFWEESVEYWRF